MSLKRTGKILSGAAALLAAILLTALFVRFIVQFTAPDKAFEYVDGGHILPITDPRGPADNINF